MDEEYGNEAEERARFEAGSEVGSIYAGSMPMNARAPVPDILTQPSDGGLPFTFCGPGSDVITVGNIGTYSQYRITYHIPTGFCIIGCQAGTTTQLDEMIKRLPPTVRGEYGAIFTMIGKIKELRAQREWETHNKEDRRIR